jgi:tetrahydromethanopterin S-methyltransferase subunit G
MEALTMETPMTEWNDDRLDELNERTKEGFAEVDKRFEQVDKRFEQVDKRFEQVDKRFDKVDKRFEQVATKDEMAEVRGQLNRLNDRFDRFLFIFLGACVGLVGSFLVAAFSLALQG